MKKLFCLVSFILLILPASAAGQNSKPKGDPVRGGILAERLGCSGCHGLNGISYKADIPNLAGQKPGYLHDQIEIFQRRGATHTAEEKFAQRNHPLMDRHTRRLSGDQIVNLVAHFSGLPCFSAPKRLRQPKPEVAEKCEVCHGGSRANPFRKTPYLAGQKAVYLKNQMRLFAIGMHKRRGPARRYHRAMELAVDDLSPDNIERLAGYFSGLYCRRP